MGANAGFIGIEHVGSETESLAPPQAAASAALIRWLLREHQITRTNIGPRFHTGLQPTGRTSCLDKLFGPVHSQGTIVAWVAANV
jgi:N-acetylmuramoyl-L-alanine amidase